MKPVIYANTFRRLKGAPAWRLLNADLAPQVLALLRHLLFDSSRILPGSVLTERLSIELALMRAEGWEMAGSPSYYIRDWLKEQWLERTLPPGENEEFYELSNAALEALRIVDSLETQRPAATESRLALVMAGLDTLARETDGDPTSRMERLLGDRRRIDDEIDAVSRGETRVLDPERARERATEVISLARELAEDFRRVRQKFNDLDRDFRERVIREDGSRGQVLTDLFAGVDVIAESPAGRTFAAFWALLTDPEQSVQLEASIDAVIRRDFARTLSRDDRLFLMNMARTLLDRAGSVNNVQTGFARSLRSYVQTREYREHQRLTRLLNAAKVDALAIRDRLRPEKLTGMNLQLSTASYRSISQWKLHDPPLTLSTDDLRDADEATISLEDVQAAVAAAEIDFRVLRASVRSELMHISQITVGQLLERHPPTQGLGTVVGYISLGVKHGHVVPGHQELVSWVTGTGVNRRARIPLLYFVAERLGTLRDG
ncbi:DUF3375 domain-containing protein [Dyella sp. 20L07]|uniref:DUF3375 domain-containing protein n=1 Tax=Dyella sp. 20L07 TaxID=3384240 RepID=UPI003D2BC5E3